MNLTNYLTIIGITNLQISLTSHPLKIHSWCTQIYISLCLDKIETQKLFSATVLFIFYFCFFFQKYINIQRNYKLCQWFCKFYVFITVIIKITNIMTTPFYEFVSVRVFYNFIIYVSTSVFPFLNNKTIFTASCGLSSTCLCSPVTNPSHSVIL